MTAQRSGFLEVGCGDGCSITTSAHRPRRGVGRRHPARHMDRRGPAGRAIASRSALRPLRLQAVCHPRSSPRRSTSVFCESGPAVSTARCTSRRRSGARPRWLVSSWRSPVGEQRGREWTAGGGARAGRRAGSRSSEGPGVRHAPGRAGWTASKARLNSRRVYADVYEWDCPVRGLGPPDAGDGPLPGLHVSGLRDRQRAAGGVHPRVGREHWWVGGVKR